MSNVEEDEGDGAGIERVGAGAAGRMALDGMAGAEAGRGAGRV
jgi:hypothetical protein